MKPVTVELPERLQEEGLGVLVAWAGDISDEYAQQIIDKSREPHVMKFEGHEDVEGRFKDMESYREWAEKERLVYLLMKGDEVGGIIWFGRRESPLQADDYPLTFGIRLYEGCVGKGLSKPFMTITHDDLKRFYPGQNIWLDFAEENIAAQKAYESFGYFKLGETDGRIVMGWKQS